MKRKLLTNVNILKGKEEGKSVQGIKVIGILGKLYSEFKRTVKRIIMLINQQGSKNSSEVMKKIDRDIDWDDEDNSSILVESYIISLSVI